MTEELHTDRPHPARVYDYLLGGEVNFPADREAAHQGMRGNPDSRIPPRQNRLFLHRAVRFLAGQGIDQFLDIGTGIPSAPHVHHVAQEINPAARVVYVDNDPIVLAHARPLLTGQTQYIEADLRELDVSTLSDVLDLNRPVGLLLIAVLHFVGDKDEPAAIVERLLAALPSGSYLALSHLTGDYRPEAWEHVTEIYRRQGVTMQVRSHERISRFFSGLSLVEPGLRILPDWRPELGEPGGEPVPSEAQVSVYGGVARKL
ncbi:SAM-dependent methyltransferase [Actinoplanes solisilvae]|uniref:SAM-dependent methyltransferase n=1 Tax=Actinoplanes solisilvae TaxID=2486853 RepID=UPI000FDB23FE|nr:SAM-dependent methyltransferase [Actinoplanes solisilvae]